MNDRIQVDANYVQWRGDSVDGPFDLRVAIVPHGPIATMLVPAPMMAEGERNKRVVEAKRSIALKGCIVTNERLIRNLAFDRRGEKTTTRLTFRPARTEAEAAAIAEQIAALVELGIAKREGGVS